MNAPITLGPTLETERLILRPPVASDFEPFSQMMTDAQTAHFIGGSQTRFAAWRSFSGMTGNWVLLGFGMFSVIERASGQWIGRIGPIHPPEWPGTEVGWGLVRAAWGKGYATEAAARAIDWVFDELGWSEVIHCIDPANANSIGVARKLGSTHLRSARLPAPIEDAVDIYGQSREAWRTRRRAAEVRPSTFKITAIDHVQVTVPPETEASAKRFYGEVLGLHEIAKPADLRARGGAWYRLGNGQLHLAIDQGASGSASRRHVCLAVDNLAAARDAMIAAGLDVIDEPIQADGLARFFLRDPAGNRVEIGQRTR